MKTKDLKKAVTRMLGTGEFYGCEVHKELASEKTEVSISRLNRILV